MAIRAASTSGGTVAASSITGVITPTQGGKPSNRFTSFTNTTVFTPGATAKQMGGFGGTWKITPSSTGNIRIRITGNVVSGVASANFNVRYGTGTAPTVNASLTGSGGTTTDYNTGVGAASNSVFTIEYEATGLTLLTAYWVDIAGGSTGGGTTFTPISVVIEEF